MNSNQLSARLVAAACEIAGVREKLPNWWLTSEAVTRCATCHSAKGIETIDLGYGDKRRVCENCGVDIYCDEDTYDAEVAVDPPRYIGPDLTDPRNLWALLAVCDAVFADRELWFACANHGFKGWDERKCEYVAKCGVSDSAAALAALAAALGIKETPND